MQINASLIYKTYSIITVMSWFGDNQFEVWEPCKFIWFWKNLWSYVKKKYKLRMTFSWHRINVHRTKRCGLEIVWQIGIDRTLSCEGCFLHEEYEDGKLGYADEMRHKTIYSVNSNCFTEWLRIQYTADKFPTKSPIWSSLIRKICTDAVYQLSNFRLNHRFETVLYVKCVWMQ